MEREGGVGRDHPVVVDAEGGVEPSQAAVAPGLVVAVVGDGLAVDVPGVTDGIVEPIDVGDAVTVSAGCDAMAVESAGWKGVGDGVSETRLSDVGIRSKT